MHTGGIDQIVVPILFSLFIYLIFNTNFCFHSDRKYVPVAPRPRAYTVHICRANMKIVCGFLTSHFTNDYYNKLCDGEREKNIEMNILVWVFRDGVDSVGAIGNAITSNRCILHSPRNKKKNVRYSCQPILQPIRKMQRRESKQLQQSNKKNERKSFQLNGMCAVYFILAGVFQAPIRTHTHHMHIDCRIILQQTKHHSHLFVCCFLFFSYYKTETGTT